MGNELAGQETGVGAPLTVYVSRTEANEGTAARAMRARSILGRRAICVMNRADTGGPKNYMADCRWQIADGRRNCDLLSAICYPTTATKSISTVAPFGRLATP